MRWVDKRNIILLHLSFWVLFLVFKVFDYANNIPTNLAIKLVLIQHVFSVVGAYFHYFLLIPLLLEKKKILSYVVGLTLLLLLCILGRGWLESIFISGIFNTDYYDKWTLARILSMFWSIGSFIVFISLMKFTIDRFVLESQKKELENEKLNAELKAATDVRNKDQMLLRLL